MTTTYYQWISNDENVEIYDVEGTLVKVEYGYYYGTTQVLRGGPSSRVSIKTGVDEYGDAIWEDFRDFDIISVNEEPDWEATDNALQVILREIAQVGGLKNV